MSDTPCVCRTLRLRISLKSSPTAIRNSPSSQFCVINVKTTGTSTYGREFSMGEIYHVFRRIREVAPVRCTSSMRSVHGIVLGIRARIWVSSYRQARQEPIHRITRCHNHRFRINPPIPSRLLTPDKSFRPYSNRSGALMRDSRRLCFNTVKYLVTKAKLHINANDVTA